MGQSTDDKLALDIRKLQRDGRLVSGTGCTVTWTTRHRSSSIGLHAGQGAVMLKYSSQGKEHSYSVEIAHTACHFGGGRAWWKCPCCKERCAILYGGSIFVCRKCAGLHYPSQHASALDKAILRAEKIRQRLGWQPGIANSGSGKPKWMRWSKYTELVAKHNQHAMAACACTAKQFGF